MSNLPSFKIGPVVEYYGGQLYGNDYGLIEDGVGWRNVLCAFHEEADASACVRTDEEQVFVCHGCGVKGNAVQVIMDYEGWEYGRALRRAKEISEPCDGEVRTVHRQSSRLPGTPRDRQGYSAYKKTWHSG